MLRNDIGKLAQSDNVAANLETVRECESDEIIRIFGHSISWFDDLTLLYMVYEKMNKRFKSPFGLVAVHFMGYINGVRAERNRRKQNRLKCMKIYSMIDQLSLYNILKLEAFAKGLLKSEN